MNRPLTLRQRQRLHARLERAQRDVRAVYDALAPRRPDDSGSRDYDTNGVRDQHARAMDEIRRGIEDLQRLLAVPPHEDETDCPNPAACRAHAWTVTS